MAAFLLREARLAVDDAMQEGAEIRSQLEHELQQAMCTWSSASQAA